jgi:four helix bundle protein
MENNNDWVTFKIDLRDRYKRFALNIIALVRTLPSTVDSRIIANQLMKAGTSCYANYRAALRGRSKPEFFSKLCIVVEETDETELWLEMLIESGISDIEMTRNLRKGSTELFKIVSHLRKTMKT